MIQPRTVIVLKITLITIPAAPLDPEKQSCQHRIATCANASAQRHARLASSHYPGVEEVEYVAEFCDRKQRGEEDGERKELVGDTGRRNGVGDGDAGWSKGGRT